MPRDLAELEAAALRQARMPAATVAAVAVPKCAPRQGNWRVRLAGKLKIGRRYRVEYKDNLSSAGWLLPPGAVKLTGTGNEFEIRDSAATAPQGFFRVRVE